MKQREEMMMLVEKIWKFYDRDHNGILEGNEYQKFLKELCKACKAIGFEKEVAKLIDKNNDGKITKIELLNFLMSDSV